MESLNSLTMLLFHTRVLFGTVVICLLTVGMSRLANGEDEGSLTGVHDGPYGAIEDGYRKAPVPSDIMVEKGGFRV